MHIHTYACYSSLVILLLLLYPKAKKKKNQMPCKHIQNVLQHHL